MQAYTAMRLPCYTVTELQDYSATRLHAKENKGVPEMAPRGIASYYYCFNRKGS